jgi:DNA-binding response OmpR family regulator
MRATAQRPQSEVTLVTIVATNPETLDGLQSYLRGAGVEARCTRDLAECTRFAADSEGNLAVVIFPDNFPWENVMAALAELAAVRPPVLPLLVTAHPQKFEKVGAAEDVIIMPRPVWGWTILDAIRAQIDRQHSDPAKVAT